jgi:Glutathione S-transferase
LSKIMTIDLPFLIYYVNSLDNNLKFDVTNMAAELYCRVLTSDIRQVWQLKREGRFPIMDTYTLYGSISSPYSMKMRAYLRYRRIPFAWVNGQAAEVVARAKVKTYMVPVLGRPDGSFDNESTALIDELEAGIPDRQTNPAAPADAFLACLLEDFADEWLINPMFHYRWHTEESQDEAAKWIIYEGLTGGGAETIAKFSNLWKGRQLHVLTRYSGDLSSFTMLEQTLKDFLDCLEAHIVNQPFLFGDRPSRAEFAIYGILSQMCVDKIPSELIRNAYPFTHRWTDLVGDLSGNDGSWQEVCRQADTRAHKTVRQLLTLSAQTHLPFLQLNDDALASGQARFEFEYKGYVFSREAHARNQGCLDALRTRYAALSSDDRLALDPILEDTGCLRYLASGQ